MSAVVEATPGAAGRRTPRIAAVLLGIGLSLALVVGPSAKPAEAYVPLPVPLAIGATLASPPGVAMGGGFGCVAMAAVCAGLAVGVVGLALYASRDTWLPVLENALNGGERLGGGATPTGCAGGVFATNRSLSELPSPGRATFTVKWAGCLTSNSPKVRWTFDQITCRKDSGAITQEGGHSITIDVLTSSGSETRTSNPLCPAASPTLVSVRVYGSHVRGETTRSDDFILSAPVPRHLFTQTSTVQCRKPDNTIVDLTSVETGHPDRVVIPSCTEHMPGSSPVGVTLGGGWPGQTPTPIASGQVVPNWYEQYPDCFTPNGALNGTCRVAVWINGVQCEAGMIGCNRPLVYQENHPQALVQCKFGSYVVPFSNCALLQDMYQTDGQTEEHTEVDPETGEVVIEPGTDTDTGGFPTTGTNPTTPGTLPNGETDPDSTGCFGAAWSWNPVDWVLVPVKCALLWAFVPSDGFMDSQLATLRADLEGTMPGAFVDAYEAQNFTLPDGGCGGIPVSWSIEGRSFQFDLLAACGGYMATAAAVVKLAGSGALVVFGGLACLRGLGAGFGWSPAMGRGDPS